MAKRSEALPQFEIPESPKRKEIIAGLNKFICPGDVLELAWTGNNVQVLHRSPRPNIGRDLTAVVGFLFDLPTHEGRLVHPNVFKLIVSLASNIDAVREFTYSDDNGIH